MSLERKDDIGVLSGFTAIDPVLDKNKHTGLMTVPEILDLIKPISDKIVELDEIKKMLEEHIQTATKSTNSPSDFNLTYVLYDEYVEKYNYVGTFAEFIDRMYNRLELSVPGDISDPINNRTKLATLETLLYTISQHNNDVTAHPEVQRSLLGGEVFDVVPRIKLDVSSDTSIFSSNIPVEEGFMIVGSSGLIESSTTYIDHTRPSTPMCLISKIKTNLVGGTFVPDGLTDTTSDVSSQYDYIDLTKGYKAFTETADNTDHSVTFPLYGNLINQSGLQYVTVSFDYRPILRSMINVSTDLFSVNLSVGAVFDKYVVVNSTGADIIIRCEPVGLGFKRVSVSFRRGGNVTYIKVQPTLNIQSVNTYAGNTTSPVGLIAQPFVEFGGHPTARITGTSGRDSNGFSVKMDSFRNYLQGTIFVEFLKKPSIDNSQVFKLHIDVFDVVLTQTQGGVLDFTVTDGTNTYTKQYVVPEDTIVRSAVSFGQGGAIIGINDEVFIYGEIESMTVIPELDAIVRDPNNITVEEFRNLSNYPVINTTMLPTPNMTDSQILETVIPYLSVTRDVNGDIVTVDSSLAGYRKEIVGVGATMSDNDRLYIGVEPETDSRYDIAFTRMIVFDVAANQQQIKYLINKYTSMYRHRY